MARAVGNFETLAEMAPKLGIICVEQAKHSVETGQFGADMKVGLVNDGPVTFWLQVDPVGLTR